MFPQGGLPVKSRRVQQAPDLLQRQTHVPVEEYLLEPVHFPVPIEGGTTMMDEKKFEGIKRQIIAENEAAYGKELREKYGDEAVEEHTARLSGMSRQEWEQTQADEEGYKSALRQAVQTGDPAGEEAREAVRLHAAWLARYWPAGAVTAQAHVGMAEMYVQDERFTDYYEAVAPGAAGFLAEAVRAYYKA